MRPVPTLLMALAVLAVASTASAGVTGPAFYVDGTLYRTVATPADLPDAPEHSTDLIYALPDQDYNVATAAPGDRDYNGGRWVVHLVVFDDYDAALDEYDVNDSGDFDSAAEVWEALDDGAAEDLGEVRRFECPVIKLPRR